MFKKIKNYIKDMDKPLLLCMIVLIVLGLFNIVSSSSREAVINLDQSIFYYFYRHLAVLILGFLVFILIIRTDTKKYYYYAPALFLLFLLLNVYLLIKGTTTRGANNWISFGFFNLQPSEVSKAIIIAYLAVIFEKFCKKFRNKNIKHYDIIALVLIVGLLIPIIVAAQKDLGTAIILIGIFGVMFIACPILRKEKFQVTVMSIVALIIACLGVYAVKGYILTDAQKSRLNFFNPCDRYVETGYQICNAYIAINNGGLTGLGIGNSTQKYSYIPEPHTDMVFAILAEENGVLRCSIIFIIYIIILYRIIRLSKCANTMRGQYICLGTAAYIFMHIFINLGGLFGMIPLTGVPLPFLSYAGSFTITLLAALAMVERISIETNRDKKII